MGDHFTSLFVQCQCGIVTTKCAFVYHYGQPSQVIDLTSELEADDMLVIDLTQED